MQNSDIFIKDSTYIAHTYNRFPVAVESGHGAVATDFDGKKYIDFGSGIGTNSLGFCNKEWISAVTAQLKKVQHTSNLFYTQPDAALAERLCIETGYRKVFFGNSGAEANEALSKLQENTALKIKVSIATTLSPLKTLFTEERLPLLPQRDRKYSINILHRLPRDFGMFPPMTNRRLPMQLMIP
jgi:acetylornithine transaminase